jgi:hypothetical protein
MQAVEQIEKDGVAYAILVRRNAQSEKKHNFLTRDEHSFQLGVNFYDAGESIRSHYHLPVRVEVSEIQEFLVISGGRVKMTLFDLEQRPFGDWILEGGDAVLLMKGGHGFEILEPTRIVEVKQGPYRGRENDKRYIPGPEVR